MDDPSADIRAPAAHADPALIASLAWAEAHDLTQARCFAQQDIDTVLCAGGDDDGRLEQDHANAQAAEQDAADQEAVLLGKLAATPAISLAGIAAKLAVVIRETEDNTDLTDFPVTQVRSALDDLNRLMEKPASFVGDWSCAGNSAASLAASCAFEAWCQGDGARYRIWLEAFRALRAL